MKKFNLVELDIIYKNFSCFLKDFDSDIQELNYIEEIDELFAFQCSRVTWYGFNNVIEIDSLVSYRQKLNDLQEQEKKNFFEIKNHLEIGLLHRTNIDSLSEWIFRNIFKWYFWIIWK